jgi:hypothetical protein
MSLDDHATVIDSLLEAGATYELISQHLHLHYGLTNGASVRTLRRFCSDRGRRGGHAFVSDEELEIHIARAIEAVRTFTVAIIESEKNHMKSMTASSHCIHERIWEGSA